VSTPRRWILRTAWWPTTPSTATPAKPTPICKNNTASASPSAAQKRDKTDGGQSRSDSSVAEDAGLVILGGEEPGQGLAELGSGSLEDEAVGGEQLDAPASGDQAAGADPEVIRLDGVDFLNPAVVLPHGFADDADRGVVTFRERLLHRGERGAVRLQHEALAQDQPARVGDVAFPIDRLISE